MGRTAVLVLAPLLILLLPVAVYATDRWMNSGDLPRNVSVAGIDVAGLTPDEALTVVRAEQDAIYAQPSLFVVNGTTFELDPADVGLTVEVETAVAQVDTAGDDGLIGGLLPWVRSFTSSAVNAPVNVAVDGDAIDQVIEQWEREAIRVPAFDGDHQGCRRRRWRSTTREQACGSTGRPHTPSLSRRSSPVVTDRRRFRFSTCPPLSPLKISMMRQRPSNS